ncbi:MAG: hypothetical protein AAGA93_09700 [Actinomycetota bacterium]
MTSAADVVVVELTNPATDGPIAVTMTLGGTSRHIADLAPGRSILLVSPPGASWEFSPATTGDDDRVFDDEDTAPGDDGGRGRSLGQ